jgi:CDP-diacylglycerol--glycerol-3-phosphate 3-phosphatidyltransferase
VDAPDRSPLLRHLPNALTTLRLAAVPVFALVMLTAAGAESPAAAAVFAFAALTDLLDGELSRRLAAQSRYGRILDPIADRLLIDVAVILLYLEDRLPLAIPVLILGRDMVLLTSLAFPWARDHGVRVSPIGKAGTVVMMIGLLLAMVTPRGNASAEIVLWSGVILLIAAGALYARAVLRLRHG